MSEILKPAETSQIEEENTISSVQTHKTQRVLDPESDYDDPMESRAAEKVANEVQTNINFRALPSRGYINSTVAETVMKGLSELDKCRPDNPSRLHEHLKNKEIYERKEKRNSKK